MCIRSAPVVCLVAMIALIVNVGCSPGSGFDFSTSTGVYAGIVTDGSALNAGDTSSAGVDVGYTTGTVTYQWLISSPGTIIGSPTDAIVIFTSPDAATVTLSVTVNDSGTGNSATSATQVTFQEALSPPGLLTVDAGPDQTVAVGNTVLLFGSVSGGMGGGSYLNIEWRQASGPVQTIPDYAAFSPVITVVGTTPGTAVFELIVWDSFDSTIVTDTVNVVVTAATK